VRVASSPKEFGKALQAFVRLLVETVLQQVPISADREHLNTHEIPIAGRPRRVVPLTEFRHFLEAAVLGQDASHACVKRTMDHGEVSHSAQFRGSLDDRHLRAPPEPPAWANPSQRGRYHANAVVNPTFLELQRQSVDSIGPIHNIWCSSLRNRTTPRWPPFRLEGILKLSLVSASIAIYPATSSSE